MIHKLQKNIGVFILYFLVNIACFCIGCNHIKEPARALNSSVVSIEIVAPNQPHNIDGIPNHLSLFNKETHIHLLVRNLTKDTLRLWSSTYSTGLKAISFEVKFNNGQISNIFFNPNIGFDANAPMPIVLSSNETAVYNVALGDTFEWQGLPLPQYGGYDTIVQIRAAYESKLDPFSEKFRIWIGKEYSKWYTYSIQNYLSNKYQLFQRSIKSHQRH